MTQSRHRLSVKKNNGAVPWTMNHEACVQNNLDLMHKALSRNHCSTYDSTNALDNPTLEAFDAHDCVDNENCVNALTVTSLSRNSHTIETHLVQMPVCKLGEMHG